MERAAMIAYASRLRSAREAALNDAEAFDAIIHTVERLGSFLTRTVEGLGRYQSALVEIASKSALAEELPKLFRSVLTPFSELYELGKDARNDAVHQGAFARHLAGHAIELGIILEDALRSSGARSICDYMVRNPVSAELWQPVGYIRQQMLAGSFSFLPILDQDGRWCLISDRAIATYLGTGAERKKRLASPLIEAKMITLEAAQSVTEETLPEDALKALTSTPLLVVSKQNSTHLLGIVTAFDLL